MYNFSLMTIDFCRLIKKHVEQGYKPVIVCSAMGKTTNSLLNAGEFALGGQVHVDPIRTLHITTATALGLSESTIESLNQLIDEVAKLLEGCINFLLHFCIVNDKLH